jgi:hypothetical protein
MVAEIVLHNPMDAAIARTDRIKNFSPDVSER